MGLVRRNTIEVSPVIQAVGSHVSLKLSGHSLKGMWVMGIKKVFFFRVAPSCVPLDSPGATGQETETLGFRAAGLGSRVNPIGSWAEKEET